MAMTGIKSGKGKPKEVLEKVIRQDMTHIEFTKNMTLDMLFWRLRNRLED